MHSGKWQMNKSDWQEAAHAALVWASAPALIYVTSILGVLQAQNHVFSWNDLVPSTFTQGGIVTWFLMQVQGVLIRFSREG